MAPFTEILTVTVTVTEALVLRPLLEDRGRITESIRILVPVESDRSGKGAAGQWIQ